MKINYLITILLPLLILGCSNPADDVSKAEVTEVTESTESPESPLVTETKGTTFTLTPDSKLEFVGSKVTGSHDGGFEKFSGSFEVDVDNKKLLEDGQHKVEIDMASTWSDNDKLTGHLKSPDFFDVEKFPKATFVLTKAVEGADGTYELSGTLDFHGVKKGISFPATVEVADDSSSVNVKAEFAINRNDFGVVYPGKPDDLIREEVVIRFDVTGKPAV